MGSSDSDQPKKRKVTQRRRRKEFTAAGNTITFLTLFFVLPIAGNPSINSFLLTHSSNSHLNIQDSILLYFVFD